MYIKGLYFIMFVISFLSQSVSLRQSLRFQLRMMSSPDSNSIFYSKKTLAEIGLNPKMVKVLESLQITKPSKIQAMSFRSITEGKHCVIGDQTGSGKTLAYLLPALQRMDEALAQGKLNRSVERSPYIVIMTPTTELASQVAKVTKTLANALKFRTSCFTSQSDFDEEQRRLRVGAEVLVATPHRLLDLLQRQQVSLKATTTLVLDEVDSLFLDESYPLQPIGEGVGEHTQFLFTSATLPPRLLRRLAAEFPGVEEIRGAGLHRTSPHITEVLIDCSHATDKSFEGGLRRKCDALRKVLAENANVQRTLIFCNTVEQCRKVENFLKREDRAERLRGVLAYHSAVEAETRQQNLKEFTKPLLRTPMVLICTDRTSRGLDFDASPVDHVVLFDFPREAGEYLRRVGRTGRAGREGLVTVLALGGQVPAAKAVIRAGLEGKRIELLDEAEDADEDAAQGEEKRRRRRNGLPDARRKLVE